MLNPTQLNHSTVLNFPLDPSVFLPPKQAVESSIVKYVCVGTAGAFIWEILITMRANYQIVLQHGLRFPTLVSFVSTITSLAFVVASTTFQTASVPSCAKLKISMQIFYLIAIPSSSLLFFFRTRAVFHKEPWVVTFFACMWLAVLASCVTPFGNNDAATIGPTKYCVVNVGAKPYTITAAIIPLINDTLVFFAISWQFWCNSSARRTLKDGVRVLIFGDYLPAFSKAMLQDGQAYCLVTVTFNLINITFIYIDYLPASIRILPSVPNLALMNIMTCRVFRNMMLGIPSGGEISTSLISRQIREIPSFVSLPLPEGGSGKQSQNAILGNSDIAVAVEYSTTHDCMMEDKDITDISAMV